MHSPLILNLSPGKAALQVLTISDAEYSWNAAQNPTGKSREIHYTTEMIKERAGTGFSTRRDLCWCA